MDNVKKPDAFSSASVNECGYILSLGIEPLERVTNAAGKGRLIFPPDARKAIVRFNAGRDRAALMLGMGSVNMIQNPFAEQGTSPPTPNPNLDAALTYAERGLAVFPLAPGSKKPVAGSRGFKDATTDCEQIIAWWADCPEANIGIATGKVSGISVLDSDEKDWENKHGEATLAALVAQHGTLPKTPTQMTWSGGGQIIFAYTPKAAQGVNCYGRDLDGRNDGGYIVVPPSRVVEGIRKGTYMWVWDFEDVPLAPMPEWLLERITATNGATRKPRTGAVKALRKGEARNVNLTSIGGTLRRKGLEPDEIEAALTGINATTNDPLPEKEVQTISNSLGRYEPEPTEASSDAGGVRYTDMMNAGRLAQKARYRAGHVAEMKDKWYIFREGRLALEPITSMVPFVREVARDLFEDAEVIEANARATLRKLEDGETLERLDIKSLKKSGGNTHDPRLPAIIEQLIRAAEMRDAATLLESRQGCYNTIELAKAEPSFKLALAQLDAHPRWLNTPSGTLDLDTGEMHPHEFADYLTKITRASYEPGATCPRWETFLAEVLPDPEDRAFMQRSVGYALTDLTDEQCMWFLHGKGRNGKTTFINTVRAVLGDYAGATKASTLMVKPHGDDRRNDVAVLRGARFVSATEAEDGQQIAEALIKEITGQDPVTARLLYAEFFTFTPTFKIFLAANHKPHVRGTDLAIWRRIHLVPFTETIGLDHVDKHLKDTLAAEGAGILNWALAGYRGYREGGLQPSPAVVAATKEYQDEMDPLSDFLTDACRVDAGASCKASDLYGAYQRWALVNGIKFQMTQKTLGLRLQDRGFKPGRDTVGNRAWRGLKPRG